jgi:hypothetical protein
MYLPDIIWYLRIAEDLDADLLKKAVRAALENDDDVALLNALAVAVARHKDHADGLIGAVFMPAFTHFAAKKDTRWVNAASHDPNAASLFRDLEPDQADAVLKSLVPYPRIEYRSEEIITSVAEIWPKKVIDFFGQRLELAASGQLNDKFDAIPFRLHGLEQPLSQTLEYVVDATRAWFEKDRTLFAYRGGRLPAIIFPNFPSEFAHKLTSVVRSGDGRDIEFVLSVLRSYEGQSFLHDMLKEIVEVLPADDRLLREVGGILDATGAVWGEFGIVEAYQQKKNEIEAWRTDPRAKVRSFAERHLLSLDRQIGVEQRRSEEDLELRKRSYGDHGGEEAS